MKNIGKNVIKLKTVDSTNKYLQESVASGKNLSNGDVFLAHYQTGGQGIGNNRWESEAGKNLTFSIYIEPAFLTADKQFMLNKSVSLALYDFVRNKIPDKSVTIKWPNDIYIENSKISGILINHTIQGNHILNSIIGIGININQKQFISNAPNPTSLIHHLSYESDLDNCMNDVCNYLNFRFQQLSGNEYEKLNMDYEHALLRFNQFHNFKVPESKDPILGKIFGVTNYGQLIITDKNGEKREFGFKEIEFVI